MWYQGFGERRYEELVSSQKEERAKARRWMFNCFVPHCALNERKDELVNGREAMFFSISKKFFFAFLVEKSPTCLNIASTTSLPLERCIAMLLSTSAHPLGNFFFLDGKPCNTTVASGKPVHFLTISSPSSLNSAALAHLSHSQGPQYPVFPQED